MLIIGFVPELRHGCVVETSDPEGGDGNSAEQRANTAADFLENKSFLKEEIGVISQLGRARGHVSPPARGAVSESQYSLCST